MKNENKELVDAAEKSLGESKVALRETQVALVAQHVGLLCMVIGHSKARSAMLKESIEGTRETFDGVELSSEQDAEVEGLTVDLERMAEKNAAWPRDTWNAGLGEREELASLGVAFDADAVYEVVVASGGDIEVAMPTVISLLTLTTPGPMTAYAPAEA